MRRGLPSIGDGLISIHSAGLLRIAQRACGGNNRSRSGGGRGARLESDASGARTNEPGIGGEVLEFRGLRQQQHRRRRKQHRIRHGDNRADRAVIIRMPIGIVIGWSLLGRPTDRIRRGKDAGIGDTGLGSPGLNRERSRRGDGVEMSERKHKLNGQRKKRQTRALLDVRSEPLHADRHPTPEREDISVTPVL